MGASGVPEVFAKRTRRKVFEVVRSCCRKFAALLCACCCTSNAGRDSKACGPSVHACACRRGALLADAHGGEGG
eukprot:8246686-Alexandrium_andersonii.AAC.1